MRLRPWLQIGDAFFHRPTRLAHHRTPKLPIFWQYAKSRSRRSKYKEPSFTKRAIHIFSSRRVER